MISVCVIGGGSSGITATKACLETDNLLPTCLEKSSELGGVWNTANNCKNSGANIYSCLTTNFSKETNCFSDFPYDKNVPPFANIQQTLDYLRKYVDYFDLNKYLKFNREVTRVAFCESKGWKVASKDIKTNENYEEYYDRVVVASGQLTEPFIPAVPGMETYTGQVIHSNKFENNQMFKDKTVLVVGLGNSGGDIAVEASRVAKKTMASCRSGRYITPRLQKNGIPHDLVFMTRFEYHVTNVLPAFVTNSYYRRKFDGIYDHTIYNLRSKYEVNDPQSSITISDEIFPKLAAGEIKLKPGLTGFKGEHVSFVDGTSEQIDCVVFATGYKKKYSFLNEVILSGDLTKSAIYKWLFPINVKHPGTIAVVGMYSYTGLGAFPSSELQSRLVASVFSGDSKLPDENELKRRVGEDMKQHYTSGRFIFKKPQQTYLNEIATELGVNPSFWRLFLRSPMLAWRVYFGPLLPCHYRIIGKHSVPTIDAKFVGDCWTRVFSTFNTS